MKRCALRAGRGSERRRFRPRSIRRPRPARRVPSRFRERRAADAPMTMAVRPCPRRGLEELPARHGGGALVGFSKRFPDGEEPQAGDARPGLAGSGGDARSPGSRVSLFRSLPGLGLDDPVDDLASRRPASKRDLGSGARFSERSADWSPGAIGDSLYMRKWRTIMVADDAERSGRLLRRRQPSRNAATRARTESRSAISHSQTTSAFQPISRRRAAFSASLSLLRSSFGSQ